MSEDLRETTTGRRGRALPDRVRLVMASFLMLFVELALIRWTAANNIFLAHLTNFVLLASFLGIGIGFLLARSERDLFPFGPLALAVLVGFLLAFPVQTVDGPHGWMPGGALGMPRAAPLGQHVGRLPAHGRGTRLPGPGGRSHVRPVRGAGGLPARHGGQPRRDRAVRRAVLPPAAAAGLGGGGRRPRSCRCSAAGCSRWRGVGVALVVLLLGAQSLLGGYYWSPYYKIRAVTSPDGSVKVDVNNTPHQTAHRSSQLDDSDPFYRYPYTYAGARDDVLVIGAGTGNDVAVALDEGAKRVDAVEIDPALQQIGKHRHPDAAVRGPAG